jgi:hypothetical protein
MLLKPMTVLFCNELPNFELEKGQTVIFSKYIFTVIKFSK